MLAPLCRAVVLLGSVAAEATPPGATLLLDNPELAGCTAYYDLNRLVTVNYSGPIIKVRRASDSTMLDIGAVGGLLDTVSLLSFCAGTDGFVVTGYDLTGNGHDITQGTTANQPKIVASGALLTGANGLVRLDFSAGTSVRLVNTSINITQPVTHVSVFRVNVWTSLRRVFDGTTSIEEGRQNMYLSSSSPDIRFGTTGSSGIINSTLTLGSWGIVRALANNTGGALQVNNGTATTGGVGTTKLRGFVMGATEPGGTGANCDFMSHGIWPSDLGANYTVALDDINAFLAIY